MSDIVFEHVGKVFPRGGGMITAVEDINLTVAEREFVAIVGPSGCGKTTLLCGLPAIRLVPVENGPRKHHLRP